MGDTKKEERANKIVSRRKQVTMLQCLAPKCKTVPTSKNPRVKQSTKMKNTARDTLKYYIQTRLKRKLQRSRKMPGRVSEDIQGSHVPVNIKCPVQDHINTDGNSGLHQGGRGTGQEKDRDRKKYERWKQQNRRTECSYGHPPELQPLPVETKPPSVVQD